MVITLVTDTFNVNNNGTTISAMRFAEALQKRGHTIRVLTCGDPAKSGKDMETGFEMYYVPELILPIATFLAHRQHTLFGKPVKSTIEKAISGSDIVHIYQPWPLGGAARKIARRHNVPAIAAFHIQPENITYNIGLKWFSPAAHLFYFILRVCFYGKFQHIHCPSKFIAAQLRSHGYKAWLHVISNGVHEAFAPGERPKIEPDGPVKVLMIGRLSPEKRQDIIIKAVKRSKYADRIQLYFAGSGPWEKKLRKMGKKLKNPPVFGYYDREGLINLIRSCHIYVHASDIEIEGISCLEAMACGLPPIIADSKRSATAQFALGPEHLFKAGNPRSLAQKLDYWIENPDLLHIAGKSYARYSKQYALLNSVKKIERVYSTLNSRTLSKKNQYHKGYIFKIFSRLFYTAIAIPLLLLWTRFVLGVKVKGTKNLRGIKAGLTVCNHVHTLDCALVGLAFLPRKLIFPTLPQNVRSLWPGTIVQVLGGVEIPENLREIEIFFDEMEILLMQNRIVHFFPEGELVPYYNGLRDFKKGAFHLAARARVPIIPMSISFSPPKGLRKLISKKPVMTLNIGKPIDPIDADAHTDTLLRMKAAREEMDNLINRSAAS